MNKYVTLGTAAMAIGIICFAVGCNSQTPQTFRDGDDKFTDNDDPIIVIGGSLKIVTQSAKLQSSDGKTLDHKDKAKHVSRIDIVYYDPNTHQPALDYLKFKNNKAIQIAIDYGADKVTFDTDSKGAGVHIVNTDPGHYIGGEVNGTIVDHQPSSSTISNISITDPTSGTKSYQCDAGGTVLSGRCTLIVHYK
jgi:hypothetical protein